MGDKSEVANFNLQPALGQQKTKQDQNQFEDDAQQEEGPSPGWWSGRRRGRHGPTLNRSNRLGNQIIIRVADNFDPGKFANWHPALRDADVNPAVNVRRVGLAASCEKVTGDR